MSNGNLSHSMRVNYAEHGVSEYYAKVGKTYRNPHFPGVKACLFDWLARWWVNERQINSNFDEITVFDMACGIGEATICVLQWHQIGVELHKRGQYLKGEESSATRGNPSIPRQKRTQFQHVEIDERFSKPIILAADPFTSEAYKERTNMSCSPLSFEEIAEGALPSASVINSSELPEKEPENDIVEPISRTLEMVICSFALHLIESPSQLFSLLWELSTKFKWLVVLAPHKKPEIKEGWGWTKWDVDSWSACQMNGSTGELLKERTHCRVYKSLNVE